MRLRWIWAGMIAVALGANGQTTVTTSGGTTGSIPVFSGASIVGNSLITQAGNNIGIGTSTPQMLLDVESSQFQASGLMAGAYTMFNPAGSVGRADALAAYSTIIDAGIPTGDYAAGVDGRSILQTTSGNTVPLAFGVHAGVENRASGNITSATGLYGYVTNYSSGTGNITNAYGLQVAITPVNGTITNGYGVYISDIAATNKWGLYQAGADNSNYFAGKVGIGTTSPGASLEVDGNLKLTANSGASITFQDGTTQSTAYTGVVCGGDFAESVDVTGPRKAYEPGDLIIIDPKHPGEFQESAEAYSTLVAGIFSTKPGYVGRRLTGPKDPDEVPLAMVGIVPTKVSAENGPIHAGDLLVASSTPGRAMKGTDRSRLTGAVVGKALGSLDAGTGVIEVLVTLQ